MKYQLRNLLFLTILCLPGLAIADIAVLIHGYHSSGGSWRSKGIVHLLGSHGWRDAGIYTPAIHHTGYPGHTLDNSPRQLVTAELPSESPIEIQAELLSQYLTDISTRFPAQPIHLIAHSAGGIVARLSLVKNSGLHIVQLITIATPHLGSPIAEMAEQASNSPIGVIAPLIGADDINRAETLYKQLSREKENYFLFWLNRQPHPEIAYTSIVRASGSLINGDRLVPPYSQNMAFVPAIGPRSRLIMTPGNHKLKYQDGLALLPLLP
mgnify:CR=1 FL=1